MARADHMDGVIAKQRLSRAVGRLLGQEWPSYAWPGGYAIAYVADDGETICADCMNTQSEIHFGGDADGWRIDGYDAYGATCDYPDVGDVLCAHCNRLIVEANNE